MLRQWVGHGSADVWLWVHGTQVIVFAALALLAFVRLARSAKAWTNAHAGAGDPSRERREAEVQVPCA